MKTYSTLSDVTIPSLVIQVNELTRDPTIRLMQIIISKPGFYVAIMEHDAN